MGLHGKIEAALGFSWVGYDPLTVLLFNEFAFGDKDDEINVLWYQEVRFLATETKRFTLDDGSMTDAISGLDIAFEKVLVFYVKPLTDDPKFGIRVNQDFSDSWNTAVIDGDVLIPGGGYLLLVNAHNGWGVPPNNNRLRLSAGISDITCEVLIVGRGTQE